MPSPLPVADRPSLRPLAGMLSVIGAAWIAAFILILLQLT